MLIAEHVQTYIYVSLNICMSSTVTSMFHSVIPLDFLGDLIMYTFS